jgi:hypothetical protein
VDPNILSLNQLSEILNKADVLAAELAAIINSIANEEEKSRVSGHASNVAGRPRTTVDLQLQNRPPGYANRGEVFREPKANGRSAAREIERIAVESGSHSNHRISSQEFGIPVSAVNADLGPSVGTTADPARVKKLLPISPILMARYNREDLYEKVWRMPVRLAAREYGVSDVAIGKVCRKLYIPVPGRGYWAKRAAAPCATARTATVVYGKRVGTTLDVSIPSTTPKWTKAVIALRHGIGRTV